MTSTVPHDLEAERAALGGVLLAGAEALDRAQPLTRESFFHLGHGWIWASMLDLVQAGQPIDLQTVAARLTDTGRLTASGGIGALAEIASAVGTAENIAFHARRVRDMAARRGLLEASGRIAELARDLGRDISEGSQEEASRLLATGAGEAQVITVQQVLDGLAEEVREGQAAGAAPALPGVPTGLTLLDDELTFGGWPRSQPTVLAGATSSGKSALANTAMLGAARQGHRVLMVALEDDARAVTKRMLSQLSGIANRRVQRLDIGWDERELFNVAISELYRQRVEFIERAAPVGELCAGIRAHVLRHHVDLVVIDFLQLVNSGQKLRTKQEHVDAVFECIVQMARAIPAATVVVSQLRRTQGRCPSKEDLYHSGALEQWAHTIALLWRPEEAKQYPNVCLLIDKQKNGPTGRITLGWRAETVSYRDATEGEAQIYERQLDKLVK